MSFPDNDSIIMDPYLPGSMLGVELVAASNLDAVSTPCHAAAAAAAAVAAAVAAAAVVVVVVAAAAVADM